MNPSYLEYGSVPGVLSGKAKAAYGAGHARPALPVLIGCLFVPWLLFVATFWVRSFEIRKDAPDLDLILSFCLFVPVVMFTIMTYNLSRTGDPKPMAFLTVTSLVAWIVAYTAGDFNYRSFMRPFYDVNNLNTYPSVDPSKYTGAQLMDAGVIEFTAGSTIQLSKSIGFKNEDIYCVAPIVSGQNASQTNFDFWAVGLNCCSGHTPDFHCGEYSNPMAHRGLRLMDDSKRDMFRLAVEEAAVTFNLKAPHPVFMYWLSDPTAEVNAYQDDGFKFFMVYVFGAFAVQLFLVLCSLVTLAKM